MLDSWTGGEINSNLLGLLPLVIALSRPGLNCPSTHALGAPAKGISGSGIKAGGDEDQVGCECFSDPRNKGEDPDPKTL